MGQENLPPCQLYAIIRREPSEVLCWMMPTCYGEAPGALEHGVLGRLQLQGRPESCRCCMGAPAVLQAGGRRAAGHVAPEALLDPVGEGGAGGGPGRRLCVAGGEGMGFDVASA